MMFRASLNRGALRRRLKQNGIVEIRNFLVPELAESVRAYLANGATWTIAIKAGRPTQYFTNDESSRPAVAAARRAARRAFEQNKFSYQFRRTWNDHTVACGCAECELRAVLAGAEMRDLLADLGLGSVAPREVFASRYSRGSFLSSHHDYGKGSAAFSLNFTRGWDPQFGGLLMFLSDDWRRVTHVCSPEFNSLCLFHLPRNRTVPHLVSPVIHGTRFAVSGWFGAAPDQRERE